jgi:uncharacterized membrane protein
MTAMNADVDRESGGDAPSTTNSDVNMGTVGRVVHTVTGGALVLYGLRRRTPGALGLAVLGGNMVRWGVTGHSGLYDKLHIGPMSGQAVEGAGERASVTASSTITIDKPVEELYAFWTDFGNLPQVMTFVESVTPVDDTHSHWTVMTPVGVKVAFDAESTRDEQKKEISWHSVGETAVTVSGSISFKPAPAGRGTEARLSIEFTPPIAIGATVARLTGIPRRRVDDTLRRFKRLMETGEIPTTHGQPAGRRSWKGTMMRQMEA